MSNRVYLIFSLLLLIGFQSYSQIDEQIENWQLDDFSSDFRGTNVEKAYTELLSKKSPQEKIIVAVIDSGIDIEHEDLHSLIWVNQNEIAGNGIDDDNNGYVDDIHGWNYLGNANGEHVDADNLEVTRLYRKYSKQFANVKGASDISSSQLDDWKLFQKVKNEYEESKANAEKQQTAYNEFKQSVDIVTGQLTTILGEDFTAEQVAEWVPEDDLGNNLKGFYTYMQENDIDQEYLEGYGDYVNGQTAYYDLDFNPRKSIIKDNPNDPYEKGYGNNLVEGPDAGHGTHVAGIIGAVRGNSIGMNGIANNIEIMVLRAVPNGDEHDKDVANAIRYAVDNGARVVNMSFGKSYTENEKIVAEAIQHAEDNDVLLVHAAGNESENLDRKPKYPTNYSPYIKGKVNTYLTVGATSYSTEKDFIADFSNYGEKKVDIFAPGYDIYSSEPDDEYGFNSGTSMAAPVVSGIAALIMSYYPDLSAKRVKKILEKTSTDLSGAVVYLPGSGKLDENGDEVAKENVSFEDLSRTAGLVNAYTALQMADKKSKY